MSNSCLCPCLPYEFPIVSNNDEPSQTADFLNFKTVKAVLNLHIIYMTLVVIVLTVTRALRTHTPHVPCTAYIASTTWTYAVDDFYLHIPGQKAHTYA